MNLDRMRQSPAGRLVSVGGGPSRYWAFLPHPLPPQLSWNRDLISTLSDADRAIGELAGLGRTLPNPHLLVRPFIQREAVLSSRIEGTQADLADIYSYQAQQLSLPGLGSGASAHDIQEVINYVIALEFGLERLSTLPLSLRLLREIHERLMAGVRGEQAQPGHFRNRQNWIGGDGRIENAQYVPPPPDAMLTALDQFEHYLHAEPDFPPLVRLALIHYQFEAIHPFVDGNGRIGRLLISLLTVHWNLLPLPLLYLSAYFEQHRARYYDLLLAISEQGAWSDWVHFFLLGVTEQATDAARRARALLDLQQQWRDRLAEQRSTNVLRLAGMLLARPVLSIPDAQQMLDVTYHTARNAIEKLVAADILAPLTEGSYGKLYAAGEIIAITR